MNKIHLFCFHSVVEKDPHWDNFGKHLLKGRPIMLTIRPIMAKELARFKELEGKCHYMGETRSGGDTLRLVIEENEVSEKGAWQN